jgi:hypothetical protein
MWKQLFSILLLVTAPVFGQLGSNTVTISATQSTYLQPDDVVFGLSVTSSVTTSSEQVVSALASLGITSANLTGISNNSASPNLQWGFTLSAPLSNLTATTGSLVNLQQTIGQNNSGLALAFSVVGTEVSQKLQQSQSCSDSELIADATAQGQKLAAAAGLTLGPVLKLSSAPVIEPSAVTGSFVLVGFIVPNSFLLGSISPPVTCSLTVEFRLQP